MFSIFKSIDTKLSECGFKKIQETIYGVEYQRYNKEFNYVHKVDICHKSGGRYHIQSYDATNTNSIYSPVVALTDYELNLFNKKINQLKYLF